jgi:hypothetical protein
VELNNLLINHGTLHFPTINKPSSIFTDVSKSAAAHVLLQEMDGVQRMVSCGKDRLKTTKASSQELSATDFELLTILLAVETYHQFLSIGKNFQDF